MRVLLANVLTGLFVLGVGALAVVFLMSEASRSHHGRPSIFGSLFR